MVITGGFVKKDEHFEMDVLLKRKEYRTEILDQPLLYEMQSRFEG